MEKKSDTSWHPVKLTIILIKEIEIIWGRGERAVGQATRKDLKAAE